LFDTTMCIVHCCYHIARVVSELSLPLRLNDPSLVSRQFHLNSSVLSDLPSRRQYRDCSSHKICLLRLFGLNWAT